MCREPRKWLAILVRAHLLQLPYIHIVMWMWCSMCHFPFKLPKWVIRWVLGPRFYVKIIIFNDAYKHSNQQINMNVRREWKSEHTHRSHLNMNTKRTMMNSFDVEKRIKLAVYWNWPTDHMTKFSIQTTTTGWTTCDALYLLIELELQFVELIGFWKSFGGKMKQKEKQKILMFTKVKLNELNNLPSFIRF